MKRCIFHHPAPIADSPNVGSKLRPNRMLQALRTIGYEVDEVTGYSEERKEKIEKIKKNIKDGIIYDFVYAENSNDPIALADADHIPRHPFMDIAFFRFCRKNQIPVGLFYRDVQWKFPHMFNASATLWKRMILIPLFQWDLFRYRKSLDHLFLPTMIMRKYVLDTISASSLPPGGEPHHSCLERKAEASLGKKDRLSLFYVGGTSNVYDNRHLFEAVKETEDVYLTVVTHKDQWERHKKDYEPFLCDRIEILHRSADEIAEYYESADLSVCCMSKDPYLDLAIPIKVFESVSYGTPLLVTEIDAVAEIVRREGIGWVVEDRVSSMKEMLSFLKSHPDDIGKKTGATAHIAEANSWESRARDVARILTDLR